MECRPKITIKLRAIDKVLNAIGYLAIMLMWGYLFINYKKIHTKVPIHFNLAGNFDNIGSKTTLFILPVIATFIVVSISIINKYPEVFNYTLNITRDNALQQYSSATRNLRMAKVFVAIIFFLIEFQIIQNSLGKNTAFIKWWFLPVFVVVICAPYYYYNYRSKRK